MENGEQNNLEQQYLREKTLNSGQTPSVNPTNDKKNQERNATKNVVKQGAKNAANAYAGPIGGKAVDLASKTKLGDTVLNKGSEVLNKANPLIGKTSNLISKTGLLGSNDDNGEEGKVSSNFMDILKKTKILLPFAGCSAILFIMVIALMISVLSPIASVANIFKADTHSADTASDDELHEAEADFKLEVEDVADRIDNKYNVTISKPLLVATVLYSKEKAGAMSMDDLDDLDEITDEEIDSLEEDTVSKYKVSKRELMTLAKHLKDGKEEYRDYLVSTYIPKTYDASTEEEIEKIADGIFDLAEYYRYLFYEDEIDETGSGCDPFNNLMVNVKGKRITFKEYVIGVVWPESSFWSANSEKASVEYGKVQTMASKTYALKHLYKPGISEITVSNTTEGFQVFCDIYTPGACGSTGTPSETQITNLRQRYDDIAGLFRVDNSGNLINTQYASTQSVCDNSSAHKGCKEDASTNAMNQTNAYNYAKAGKSYEQILDIYYQGHNGSFGDSVGVCTSSGNWETWKQSDPKWANVTMGNSTISHIGCLATSIAMLVKKAGASTNVSGDFNPGSFVETLRSKGGFTSGGGLYWESVSKVVPGFKYLGQDSLCGLSQKQKAVKVNQLLKQGYYVTLEVKGKYCGSGGIGQHWVAVTGVDLSKSKIYMADPAGLNDTNTDVFNKYSNLASMVAYYKYN